MIKAEVKGLDRLQADLKKLFPEAQKKFLKLASTAIFKDIAKNFEAEKDSGNQKWKRFKWPDGKIRNQRPTRRGGTKLLQDTGRLKNSVLPFVEKNAAGARTNLEYAVYHNEGTKRIPRREFAYARPETEEKLEKYLADEIGKQWDKGTA